MTYADREKPLECWSGLRASQARKCIHAVIEAQVARTPDAIALEARGQRLTYRELNSRSNSLARYLQTVGVAREVRVGVCMTRTPDMVVALLAVLKAGGAYVPLDPAYPRDRLGHMLEDSQAPVVLTQQGLADRLPKNGIKLVCADLEREQINSLLETDLTAKSRAEDLAYVIYTSGSTGARKASRSSTGAPRPSSSGLKAFSRRKSFPAFWRQPRSASICLCLSFS